MMKTLTAATILHDLYQKKYSIEIEQNHLYDLMYLLQREALIQRNKECFRAQFKVWKDGLAIELIRDNWKNSEWIDRSDSPSPEDLKLMNDFFARYGGFSFRTIDNLVHDEFSWKYSFINCKKGDSVKTELIQIDAVREKIRRELENQ